GDKYQVECPTGSGQMLDLWQVAGDISQRLTRIFLLDHEGRRPVFGGTEKFQTDPHGRNLIPFHEYFHGDNGAGIGASHQTGWTALIASMIHYFATTSATEALNLWSPSRASHAAASGRARRGPREAERRTGRETAAAD